MKANHKAEVTTVTGTTCEYWVNMRECTFRDLSSPEPMPPAIYCGKPAKFSRTFVDGTRQALCLTHRLHHLRIHYCVTAEDWIQDHIKHDFCWCGWFRWRRK